MIHSIWHPSRARRAAAVTALALAASAVAGGTASAATLTVDDDAADCPAATYRSIQSAVDAAADYDTVIVCAGDYAEGTGAVGTNALTITKNLTLKGAGADLVSISPKATTPTGGQLFDPDGDFDIRSGIGNIVSVVGSPTRPITVDISGITVDGYDPAEKPIAVAAGVVYLDAKGSIVRSRVTNTVTSEGDTAYLQTGGYRGNQPGIGIVQTSRSRRAQVDGTRTLRIELTRVDKYNRYGVLIDSAQNDDLPLLFSGAINRGEINSSVIVGRTQCVDYAGTGNCSPVGPVTTGPLFGQDGLRVTAGARAQVFDSFIAQNLTNGLGAPTRGNGTTPGNNPGNLSLGAGIRLIGAKMTTNPVSTGLPRSYNTSVTRSSIVDNGYGALNFGADGVTPNTGTPNTDAGSNNNILLAENNWWGQRIGVAPNNGPMISPVINPPWPENPVGGTGVADPVLPTLTTSNSVDFVPFRNGLQADPDAGQFAIPDAPLPVSDGAPTNVTLRASSDSVAPGGSVELTAEASDDFGIKRVRIWDGPSKAAELQKPPYTQTVKVPADAVCGSIRNYAALATDSIDQTTASSAISITVSCPTDPGTPPGPGTKPVDPAPVPAPAPPTIKFGALPKTISGATTLTFDTVGAKSVEVRLGSRTICRTTTAPFSCKITPTGADVGRQALTAVVTDANGSTSSTTTQVTVPKFRAKVALKISSKKVRGGKLRRTINGRVVLPKGVTKAQGCRGKVTISIKRGGQSFLNQRVSLSKKCTFRQSVTASRSKQRFVVSARFGGNSVLSNTAQTSRRFS